jgi:hypothetical protein
MSTDKFIGHLEDYLDAFDGATPLPDRVRDAIRAELPSARQVHPRRGFERIFTVLSNRSAGTRLGLAAAAVVVVVVLGGAFIGNNRNGNVGGPGAPTPSATSATSPSPTPGTGAVPPALRDGAFAPCDAADTSPSTCLSAGTYQLNNWRAPNTWPVKVTLNVPPGWFNWDAGPGVDALLVSGGPKARGDSGWGVLFSTVSDVARDPCDTSKGVIPAAQIDTPQKLAAAIAAWPQFRATAPQPVTLDGHDGLKLQLTSTGLGGCGAQGWLWRTTTAGRLDAYPMMGSASAAPGTFEIIGTAGGLIVIRTTDFADTSPTELAGGVAANPTRHAADLTVLHGILDSIRLTALPTSS